MSKFWPVRVTANVDSGQVLFFDSPPSVNKVPEAMRWRQGSVPFFQNRIPLNNTSPIDVRYDVVFAPDGLLHVTFLGLHSDDRLSFFFSPTVKVSEIQSFLASNSFCYGLTRFSLFIDGKGISNSHRQIGEFCNSSTANIAVRFVNVPFRLVFLFKIEECPYKHCFLLWFEPFAEAKIAMAVFANLLPREKHNPFLWYFIKIESSSGVLLPSDDLSIETTINVELTVRVVSKTISY
jgi:hypothetical protein